MSIANERKLVLHAFCFATAIFVILSYFKTSDDAFQHEAYRHAAEASLLEGQPKPERHRR
jgi:hypothetical protein